MHAAVDSGSNENEQLMCEGPNYGRVLVAPEVMALSRRSGDGRVLRTHAPLEMEGRTIHSGLCRREYVFWQDFRSARQSGFIDHFSTRRLHITDLMRHAADAVRPSCIQMPSFGVSGLLKESPMTNRADSIMRWRILTRPMI
jgi:hypothetical protein